jgi:hypothetical protein
VSHPLRERLRRAFTLTLPALVALVLNAALWLRARPEPLVHDEFGYLLAADTFAHGRLTNPTHPMWRHFETFHVLQRPTYQSKYPPGPGLLMALGTVVAGHPIAGVWVAFALACAAVTWMLQGWLPPPWPLAGGLLAALQPVMGAWWAETYWGGALPMAAGALVYGAVPRLIRAPRAAASAALGAGLALLLLSRPLEGAIASLPALAFLCWRRLRAKRGLPANVWAPAAAVLAVATLWLGYYHWRVTGDPFRPPWLAWSDTYQRADAVMHPDMRLYHGSPPLTLTQKLIRLLDFYLPFPLVVGLLGLWWTWRSRWTRAFAAAALGLVAASVALSPAWPHYTAPVAAAILAVLTQGFRGLWLRWRAWPLRAGIALCAILPLSLAHSRGAPLFWIHAGLGRERIQRELEALPDGHLVFVRYGRGHDASREWVYNEADIDAARVVWAREVGPDEDAALVRYFEGRQVWLLEPDENPPRLTAMRAGQSPARPRPPSAPAQP